MSLSNKSIHTAIILGLLIIFGKPLWALFSDFNNEIWDSLSEGAKFMGVNPAHSIIFFIILYFILKR